MSVENDQFSIEASLLASKLTALVTYSALPATVTKLGIVTGDNTELSGVVTPFVTAQNAVSNKNVITPTMIKTRDIAQVKAVAVARKFVLKWYYNNGKAEATDVMTANLKPHSEVRETHEGAMIDMPVVHVEPMSGHRFDVIVLDATTYKAKPVNIVFFRVRYFVVTTEAILPPAPANYPQFVDTSKQPIILTFPDEQAGLQIAISVCYVDAQGVEGPYCAVVHTNIS